MEQIKYYLSSLNVKKLLIIVSSIITLVVIILLLVYLLKGNKFELNKTEIMLDIKNKRNETIYTTLKSSKSKNVSFTSLNENIATVDENGRLTSVNIGETTVKVRYEEKEKTVKIIVVENIEDVIITNKDGNKDITNKNGDKNTVTTDKKDKDTTNTSNIGGNDTPTTNVNNPGGKDTITTDKGGSKTTTKSDEKVITSNEVTRLSLKESMIYLKPDDKKTLTLNIYPKSTENPKITWTSSNKKVAIVNDGGIVTGISKGTAIITAMSSNGKKATCVVSVLKSYEAVIKPPSNEKIIYSDETKSLKVYISNFSNYYLTRIWAEEPYKQLNKFDSPNYGNDLYRPGTLLQKAIERYNLKNKLIVGFNASGFYLKDTYDSSSVSRYLPYDKTSVGTLVITDGKVIRNVYDKAYKTWFITGIDKNNNLKIFTDSAASSTGEKDAKKKWANDVISSGIRNTYTFASPLVLDGKKSNITTSMPSMNSKVQRQAICQVNKNNFALITGMSLDRTDLINIMLDLKCQTGTNFDGGGSIALLFKKSNSSEITTIIGNRRNLPEVGYFSEL